ncbi:MAG: PKD domain-containing protein [Chitinophagaceae bacterium]|nr:MAG: PKD domain-containing protein [Chitinophagaceae bacterium]
MHRTFQIVFCLCITITSVLIPGLTKAQPKAAFTSSAPSGCAPLVVNFADASSGNPLTWKWDLGNGTISTLKNPTASYFNPGTYTVKLVVRNAAGVDSVIRQQYVTVYSKPVPAFRASDTSGCFPLAVSFTDMSAAGSGTVEELAWDFGDGTTSAEKSPTHIYQSAGNFTVSVRVKNSNGCFTTATKSQYIRVSNGVKASFTNTTAAACESSPLVRFTSTSTGPGNLSYEWQFGDGGVSALQNPVHIYILPGTYSVSLVVTSPQGCRDTLRKENLISFGHLLSAFSMPDSICAGVAFVPVNNSSPVPSNMSWNFGDGTTSSSSQPYKSYPTPGIYRVRLVNNFGACRDTIYHNIVVKSRSITGFTASALKSCQVPFKVKFKTTNLGIFRYAWDFGDGAVSSLAEPEHTYTSTGVFDVRLILTNLFGCSDTLTRKQYITIAEPTLAINGFPQTGCAPLTVRPTATVSAGEAVTGWEWSFGDGSSSRLANPVYTYTRTGTYNVSLTITTATGCKKTVTVPNAVRVGARPVAAFRAQPNDVCASQPVFFTDSSKGSVDQWLWNFGDGGTSTQQNPRYTYSDTGYFSVTLIVWNNTCSDTIRLRNIVHIKPPIAAFVVPNDCVNPFRKTFRDQSIGANTWYWSFGDGQTSTLQHPVHTYSSPGSYTVTLVITNGSCSHTSKKTVVVMNEEAAVNLPASKLCKDGLLTVNAGAMNAANIQSWSWDFGDAGPVSSTARSAEHVYTRTGNFRVKLTTRDLLGCVDTASAAVTVYGPKASFNVTAISSCLGAGPVSFIDQSVSDGSNPIVKYRWIYGDGSSDSTSAGPFRHNYNSTGNYNVSLTVTDAFGCTNTITREQAVIISRPVAAFFSPDTLTCTGKPVSFINGSTGNDPVYSWSFGDASLSTAINPVHSYTRTGLYDVKLVATDRYGCIDSVSKPRYINVSLPVAGFRMSDSIGSCPPLKISFTSSASNYIGISWDFGDGNSSVLVNPEHTYTFPGIYFAKQVVTGPGGCEDVVIRRIVVKGPTGSFDYSPKTGCNPLTVKFTAHTKNSSSFLWDFTDGNTSLGTDSVVSHTYTSSGDYIPRMILTDAMGCNVPLEGLDTIHVVGVKVDFTPDTKLLCDQGSVRFENHTVSNDYIRSWSWDFGDGSTSSEQHPVHYYSRTGRYRVVLRAVSATGCTDSLEMETSVVVAPRPLVKIHADKEACIPATTIYTVTVNRGDAASLTWDWNFGSAGTSVLQSPAPVTYTVAGSYAGTLIVTDSNGCRDTATHTFSARPLPATNAGNDRVYCYGTPVQLKATGASTYTWLDAAGLSCTTCDAPLAAPEINSIYRVEGKNEFGCVATDSLDIRVRRPFTIRVSPDDTLCLGTSVKLNASGADLYTWSPAAGLSGTSIASPVATPSASTRYIVTGRDSDGCFTDTASVRIKVYPIPVVDAGADITLAAGASTTINTKASDDVTKYSWSPAFQISCINCPAPVINPRKTMEYTVTVANDGGCKSKDDVKVFVTCSNGNLFIPNTFSPDGNGVNDKFYPRGTGIHLIRTFRVFNRWGQLVYEASNFKPNEAAYGWDGMFKGKQVPADVFIYTCEVMCLNDEIIEYKGDVTLLR